MAGNAGIRSLMSSAARCSVLENDMICLMHKVSNCVSVKALKHDVDASTLGSFDVTKVEISKLC